MLTHTLAAKAFSRLPACKPHLVRPLSFHLLDGQLTLTSACSPLTGDGPLRRVVFLIHLCTPHRHSLPRAGPRERYTQSKPQWLTPMWPKWPKSYDLSTQPPRKGHSLQLRAAVPLVWSQDQQHQHPQCPTPTPTSRAPGWGPALQQAFWGPEKDPCLREGKGTRSPRCSRTW